MPNPFNFLEQAHPVQSLRPATDAAGRTGDYANLKHAAKAVVLFHIDQANAATVACSVMQAKDAAATGAKAVAGNLRIAASNDVSAASGDILAEQPAAASFTTDAGLKPKIVAIEVDPLRDLDVAGGFTWIAAKTGASNVANLTQAVVILSGLRYAEKPVPSARV